MVRSPSCNSNFFYIIAGVLQEHLLAPYMLMICQDYTLEISVDQTNRNGFTLKKKKKYKKQTIFCRKYIRDADFSDNLALIINTPAQIKSLLRSVEETVESIDLYLNPDKTRVHVFYTWKTYHHF